MATKRTTRSRGRGGAGWRYVIPVVLLAGLIIVLIVLVSRFQRGREAAPAVPAVVTPDTTAFPPSRSVVLFFGREDADGMKRELREIRAEQGVEEGVRAVVGELVRGPGADGVPSIPPHTTLRKALFDERSGTLYLDFSKQLQAEHWGGSEGELLTVRSILQTIAANFPTVKAVQILVEGEEIESIAGHIDTSRPFDLAGWLRADREGPEGGVFEESAP